MHGDNIGDRIEGFNILADVAIRDNRLIRCVSYDITLTADDILRLDSTTKSLYSRCKWILVEGD